MTPYNEITIEVTPMCVGIDPLKMAQLIRKLCQAIDASTEQAIDCLNTIITDEFSCQNGRLRESEFPALFQKLVSSHPELVTTSAMIGLIFTTYLARNTLMNCIIDNDSWHAVERQYNIVSHNEQGHQISVFSIIKNNIASLMATFVLDDNGLLRVFNPQLEWELKDWIQWADRIEKSEQTLSDDLSRFAETAIRRLTGFDQLSEAATAFQNALGRTLSENNRYTHTLFATHAYCEDCNKQMVPKQWTISNSQLQMHLDTITYGAPETTVCRGQPWRNPTMELVNMPSGTLAIGTNVQEVIDQYFTMHCDGIHSFNHGYAYQQQFVQAAKHSLIAVEVGSDSISAFATKDGKAVFVFGVNYDEKESFKRYQEKLLELGVTPLFEQVVVDSDTFMAIDIKTLPTLTSLLSDPTDQHEFTSALTDVCESTLVTLPMSGQYAVVNFSGLRNKQLFNQALSMLPESAQCILNAMTAGKPMLVMVKQVS